MNLKTAISYRIIELCKNNDITLNKLSTMSGITQSTLNDVVYGKTKNPTIKTIYYVCSGLGIELKDFFDSKYFSNLTEE